MYFELNTYSLFYVYVLDFYGDLIVHMDLINSLFSSNDVLS